jgi:heat shock protein HslJ
MQNIQKSRIRISLVAFLCVFCACSGQRLAKQESPENPVKTSGEPARSEDSHTSRQSIDWPGVYKGIIPCADCGGIETVLTLLKDQTYTRTLTYVGKEGRPRCDKGTFDWDISGSVIILKAEDGTVQHYQVGENILFHLDREGKRVTGDLRDKYVLKKNLNDPGLEGKKWILTELMGQKIGAGQTAKQAFLIFNPESSTYHGNGSCNNLYGSYELKEGNRIIIGETVATRMACPDMELERLFFEVLEKTDNYSITGSILSLNKGHVTPLARFTPANKN